MRRLFPELTQMTFVCPSAVCFTENAALPLPLHLPLGVRVAAGRVGSPVLPAHVAPLSKTVNAGHRSAQPAPGNVVPT